MNCAIKATLTGVLAAVLIVAGAIDLSAQSNAEKSVAFVGKWGGEGREFDQQAACGPQHGGQGRCTVPLDKLKPLLHPRALAWMQFAGLTDERLAGMFECAPTPFPSLLADGWTITMLSEGLMRIGYGWTSGGFMREVYMDGRKHRSDYNRFTYMGEAIGRFEGNDLVIETTNFTFDTDGLDDHLHLPSSMRKKMTERYTLTAPDKITLTITHEDSLFLKAPFTFTMHFKRDDSDDTIHTLPAEITPCDVNNARSELDLLPDKYRGK